MADPAKPLPFGISVVIPTYNRASLLARAVESVVTSRPDDVEIVVVDDASDYNVAATLPVANANGVAIRCYRLPRNAGAQSARNLGIRRARRRYVAFLDSDDCFTPEKLDILLKLFASDDIDLLFHRANGYARIDRIVRYWQRFGASIVPFRWLLALLNPIPTPTLVVRRECRLGPPSFRHSEDYAFLLHYCRPSTRITYLDQELAVVDRRPGSAGGLSAAAWKMRKGEFAARRLYLREPEIGSIARFVLGSIVGAVRIANDIRKRRYG